MTPGSGTVVEVSVHVPGMGGFWENEGLGFKFKLAVFSQSPLKHSKLSSRETGAPYTVSNW